MKMFKTILKPFDSQVMVPYEYISTDIYASKKVTINLMAIYREQNWPLVPYSNACHMAQRKVCNLETFSPEVNLLNGEKMLVI